MWGLQRSRGASMVDEDLGKGVGGIMEKGTGMSPSLGPGCPGVVRGTGTQTLGSLGLLVPSQ